MSLSHKQYKKLEELNFPFKKYGHMVNCPFEIEDEGICNCIGLEELIEECGEDLEALERENYPKGNVYWKAYMTEDKFDKVDDCGCVRDCCGYEYGDTPIEAVYDLYIVLHE